VVQIPFEKVYWFELSDQFAAIITELEWLPISTVFFGPGIKRISLLGYGVFLFQEVTHCLSGRIVG
jgi:hypothetical protein